MRNDDEILDAIEEKIGPRTCPECGYQFPYKLFVKRYILKFDVAKWKCPSCHELIKFNDFRFNVIGAIIFFVCIFSFLFIRSKFELDLPLLVFLIPFFTLILILVSFEKFEKKK